MHRKYWFSLLREDADLSHEQELNERVAKSSKSIKIFGTLSWVLTFKVSLKDCGLLYRGTDNHLRFQM